MINHNIFGIIIYKVALNKWKLCMNKIKKDYYSIFWYSNGDNRLYMNICSYESHGKFTAYNYRNNDRNSDIYHMNHYLMGGGCKKRTHNEYYVISAKLPKNWW